MLARPHPRQSERLAALHRYEILDTPKEDEFDDIVELAKLELVLVRRRGGHLGQGAGAG